MTLISGFPNGVSSFGVPIYGMGGFIPAGGTVYWVWPGGANSSDGNSGLSPDEALVTLSKAHSLMTANQNDVAILVGNSSASSTNVVAESSTLTWSKNLCHIIGTAYNRTSHRCSIRSDGTEFTPLVNVTADGCVFANFHVYHGYDDSSAQIAWAETGQRNAHFNLHIAGMGHQTAADHTGGRSLTLTGDGERYFQDCTFGLDTVDRGEDNATVELLSAAVRDEFHNCKFIMRADATTPEHVKLPTANSIDRWVLFKDCQFFNAGTFTGASTIDDVFDITGGQGGVILLNNCVSAGAGDWDADDTGAVYVEPVYANSSTGITVATSA